MWAQDFWKVFLYDEEAIVAAIRYVEENPVKEGKRPQKWPFVTPFSPSGDAGPENPVSDASQKRSAAEWIEGAGGNLHPDASAKRRCPPAPTPRG